MFTEEVQNASEITLKCNQRFGHLKSQKKKTIKRSTVSINMKSRTHYRIFTVKYKLNRYFYEHS